MGLPTSSMRWCVGCFAACVLLAWGVAASAQTFFKWTDERGVVHFSDSPPPRTRKVEERTLNVPPVVTGAAQAPAESEATENGEAGKAESGGEATSAKLSKPEGGETAKAKDQSARGPAKVVLVAREAPRTGPSALHVSGEVKNVGGQQAESVVVSITAVDSTQGTPCLEEEAEVTPGSLRPGETGNFDIDLDSPCLYGDPNLDVRPDWE